MMGMGSGNSALGGYLQGNWNLEQVGAQVDAMGVDFNVDWKDSGTRLDMAYYGGRAVAEIALMFVGVGEVKAALSGTRVATLAQKGSNLLRTIKAATELKFLSATERVTQFAKTAWTATKAKFGAMTERALAPLRKLWGGADETVVAGNGKEYFGPFYEAFADAYKADPTFFPNPDTTVFEVISGDAAMTARRSFSRSGLKGHHVHPIAHGGPAVPGADGLAYTGETTYKRLEGLDQSWMRNPSSKMVDWHAPNPSSGILLPGKNPVHSHATWLWRKFEDWQRLMGVRNL